MTKRSLQIDVLGEVKDAPGMIECNLYVDGRCCTIWTTKSNYEALLYDKVFIRDGKVRDSANILNTTNVFYEEIKK